MSITYNASTNFGAKDALPVNDPDKVIYGAEFTTEFTAITAAFGNAAPTASPTFTGTATFSDVDINGTTVTIGSESISDTLIGGWNTTKSTVDAGATNWDTAYGWGDHGAAGYATSSDLTTATANSANWDEAYGWGDHSTEGYSTTDTTYTGGTNISLSGTTFNLDSTIALSQAEFSNGVYFNGTDWLILHSGTTLKFYYNGSARMSLDSSGNLTVLGNVTAYGSP